jgi:hypothetical protein
MTHVVIIVNSLATLLCYFHLSCIFFYSNLSVNVPFGESLEVPSLGDQVRLVS